MWTILSFLFFGVAMIVLIRNFFGRMYAKWDVDQPVRVDLPEGFHQVVLFRYRPAALDRVRIVVEDTLTGATIPVDIARIALATKAMSEVYYTLGSFELDHAASVNIRVTGVRDRSATGRGLSALFSAAVPATGPVYAGVRKGRKLVFLILFVLLAIAGIACQQMAML